MGLVKLIIFDVLFVFSLVLVHSLVLLIQLVCLSMNLHAESAQESALLSARRLAIFVLSASLSWHVTIMAAFAAVKIEIEVPMDV